MSEMKNDMLAALQHLTIYNASRLGWNIESINENGKIVLKKKLKDMTYLDRNTFKLLEFLMNLKKD